MAARSEPRQAPAPPAQESSFESALERLEEIVDRLEQGDLELEAALGAFEEGVRLSKRCAGELSAAERRIEKLVREGDEWITRPFADEPDAGAADDGDDA